MTFILKCPKKLKTDGDKPPVEFVSMGNLSAELAPNATVTTDSPEFRDFLIENFGLTDKTPDAPVVEETPQELTAPEPEISGGGE